MSDPVLQGIADDLAAMDARIKQGEEYLSVAEEAGENVADLRAKLRDARAQRQRWADTLANRGYKAK
jgi:hypothetical protein